MCHGIVSQHGGAIAVESEPGRGTTVSVWWPMAHAGAPTVPDAVPIRRSDPDRRWSILLVDDDAGVRTSTRRVLQRAGYLVTEAVDGADALRHLDGREPAVDLVITDVVMPGMSGVTLADMLRERAVAPPVLFMTGHLGDIAADGPPLESRGPVLRKPFTPRELLDMVQHVLAVPGVSSTAT